ncbi:FAD-dependent oxidoreductase [Treponema parvum]|uniref:FAD-dependent oxidoreductase n=1 Tax=Treponema parvum TaxID=138851 RepID=UPI001AEBD57D|nr:FAD-binding protein [Treponema parvum]QTQ15397.1 FAD-binding protein [Treponema parvum]
MKACGTISNLKAYLAETVVLGSGAAGFNAADLLHKGGAKDIVLVTESIRAGTSRNTGSDKQTYYKLSLAGSDLDSIRALAGDLFKGRCVDGDIALCEASLSAPSFLRLADMGVPFPQNRYGEYIGYKTDHDPFRRATSAGPYTSKFMTECLEKAVLADSIEIADGLQCVKILVKNNQVKGIVVLSRKTAELSVIFCRSLVLATGGPAGIYSMSVYPESQYGAAGIAFEAGCMGKNLTEWQYGLASVKPRWNVSGSYMQVLPRFVSVDKNGKEYDFLSDYPYSKPKMLSMVFLKGYQWPFDVRKLEKGSSIIDILCHLEIEKGRKVYLDYIHNPGGKEIPWKELSEEARSYLESSGATGETPVKRLRKMNEPAYNFYLDKGVDLEKEYLEISLSAQHNNGGLSIDAWWQSNVEGIFPVGECAASHGVYRPGGSALNAGQCGSRRATAWILAKRTGGWKCDAKDFDDQIRDVSLLLSDALTGSSDALKAYEDAKTRMSLSGSAIRNADAIRETLEFVCRSLENFNTFKVERKSQIWILFEFRNALLTQKVYLASMLDYLENGGKSRGSSLYTDPAGQIHPVNLDDRFIYDLEDERAPSVIQEASLVLGSDEAASKVVFSRRPPRPIPENDDFFENVWARYRSDKCVF